MSDSNFEDVFGGMISALQARIPVYAVILFGSHARGQAGPYSDYDIIIIADFEEKYLDRGRWVVQLAPPVPTDIFCYTPAEFEKMFNTYRLTAIDAIWDGIVLAGEEFVSPFRERLADFIRRGMHKTQCCLIPPSS